MVVLGIDPGSLNTGYGVVMSSGSRVTSLACGVIRLQSAQSHAERIGRIYRELEKVVKAYRPERAAIETVFLCRNAQSALKLGQVRGAIIALVMNSGLELCEYAPREVKLAVTGRGSATKEQVSFMVTKLLGLETAPEPYDITDALGIALCDISRSGNPSSAVAAGRARSGSGGWSRFVRESPHMVIR
ncbi:MAG: crossover junction endodeoxyribonuclease RuvC [Chlorobiaceae bacterium]|nr:crossover junction endodeoxyribonuclease RuvC [Chlorobiaceae bacterium]NTW11035.1 crossover junction endodeoxyribonuclease RuvC [Chlorobiaceae bacterium]